MGTSSTRQRRLVRYSGRVQGVGFRYTTRQIASRFAVTGYVRNLADGRVEVVVEGAVPELDRFLDALHQQMADYILASQVDQQAASGEFSDFEIRV